MQINVTVDGLEAVDLSTELGQEIELVDSETGEYVTHGRTLGDHVVERLVAQVARDPEYQALRRRVAQVRTEMIREALAPMLVHALNGPVQRTDGFGQATGEPTTLREMIVAEFRDAIKMKDGFGRTRTDSPIVKLIRDEISVAFRNELAGVIAAEKEKVVKKVRDSAADMIAKAATAGLR